MLVIHLLIGFFVALSLRLLNREKITLGIWLFTILLYPFVVIYVLEISLFRVTKYTWKKLETISL